VSVPIFYTMVKPGNKGYIPFESEGRFEDLPKEIIADIEQSFKAYFDPETNIVDDWDVDRHCAVYLSEKTQEYKFCKMVMSEGKTKVMVVGLPREMTDQWMKGTS